MKTINKHLCRLLAGAALFLVSPTNGSAEDCNGLLVPDVGNTQMNLVTSLSYLAVINKDNFEWHKKNGGGGGSMFFGAVKGSAGFEDFKKKREVLYAQYGFTGQTQDLSSYYTSQLPYDRAKLYAENCLHRHGFFAHIEKATEAEVFVKVLWEKSHYAPDSIPFVHDRPRGGRVAAGSSLPKKLSHDDPKIVTFERSPGEDFRFVVNVPGADPQLVFVPRFIKEDVERTKTLAEQIDGGADFTVSFAKPVGFIQRDWVVHGYYRKSGEWITWSGQRDHGKRTTRPAKTAKPLEHKFLLWGTHFTFDDGGTVYRQDKKKYKNPTAVGTMRPTGQ